MNIEIRSNISDKSNIDIVELLFRIYKYNEEDESEIEIALMYGYLIEKKNIKNKDIPTEIARKLNNVLNGNEEDRFLCIKDLFIHREYNNKDYSNKILKLLMKYSNNLFNIKHIFINTKDENLKLITE